MLLFWCGGGRVGCCVDKVESEFVEEEDGGMGVCDGLESAKVVCLVHWGCLHPICINMLGSHIDV